jgi:hypothetical protein
MNLQPCSCPPCTGTDAVGRGDPTRTWTLGSVALAISIGFPDWLFMGRESRVTYQPVPRNAVILPADLSDRKSFVGAMRFLPPRGAAG